MSFKKSRTLLYNNRIGQRMVQNGITQQNPIDRKLLALEGQKKVSLTLTSSDRDGYDADTQTYSTDPTNCIVTLADTVRGVYGYRVLEFQFRNLIYNVAAGINDRLVVAYNGGTPPVSVANGIIIIPEGMYTGNFEPVTAYISAISKSLNNILYSDLTLWLPYNSDIRVALLIAAAGAITSIVTNPSTGRVTLTWASLLAPTILFPFNLTTKLPQLGTTIMDIFPFLSTTTGATWVTSGALNTTSPELIGLKSPVFNNAEIIHPNGDNEFFLHVPVLVLPGQTELYAPVIPTFFNFNSQQTLSRIEIAMFDHTSLAPLRAPDLEWQMLVELFTVDATPAT